MYRRANMHAYIQPQEGTCERPLQRRNPQKNPQKNPQSAAETSLQGYLAFIAKLCMDRLFNPVIISPLCYAMTLCLCMWKIRLTYSCCSFVIWIISGVFWVPGRCWCPWVLSDRADFVETAHGSVPRCRWRCHCSAHRSALSSAGGAEKPRAKTGALYGRSGR